MEITSLITSDMEVKLFHINKEEKPMKVALKINHKSGSFYGVSVYQIIDSARVFWGIRCGRIDEIIKKISDEIDGENVEIEKSIFEGWY